MRITIDTDTKLLRLAECDGVTEHSLFSPEAFRILSRHWMVLGWNLGHWQTFSWMGRQLLQFPDDVLRLAEVFWKLRPDVIVEAGVYDGGSTLLFASLCRLSGTGRVISIDREFRPGVREAIRQHAGDLVTLLEGDSASVDVALQVGQQISGEERVCVFLDADHTAKHVAAELRNYSPLVSQGCYLIVADSISQELADAPEGEVAWRWDNPESAVRSFLLEHPEFSRERPTPQFSTLTDFTELSYFASTWLLRR